MGNSRPKAKKMRRFGEVLVARPKYQRILERRPHPPGAHGREKAFRRGRQSDYGLQLEEKQKLAFIYNIQERQMRNYYKAAAKMPGVTGDNMLMLMERRLDNIVYKLGFAATIWAAQQLVGHGHIMIEGSKLDVPSYSVVPDQTITLRERMRRNPDVELAIQSRGPMPDYLEFDQNTWTGTLKRNPERDDIQIPVNEQLVVEWYTRKT